MILSIICYKSNDYFSISKGYRDIYDNMTSNKHYYKLDAIGVDTRRTEIDFRNINPLTHRNLA